jgi:hypothetical protein
MAARTAVPPSSTTGRCPSCASGVNGNKYDGGDLGPSKSALRAYYRSLIEISTLPAIAEGELLSLQEANKAGSTYCSLGRWCYTFLRYAEDGSQVLMILANLNPENTYRAFVIVPQQALDTVGLGGATSVTMRDRLDPDTPHHCRRRQAHQHRRADRAQALAGPRLRTQGRPLRLG